MTAEKQKDIIRLYAEHEQRLSAQLKSDTALKSHFEKMFQVTLSRTKNSLELAIESDDKRALGLAKRGFAHLATFLVTNKKLDAKTLYDLAPTLAPERKEPMYKPPQSSKKKPLTRKFNAANNNEVMPPQKEIIGILHSVAPKTENQAAFMDAISDNSVTFGVGPAGTGKTFLAACMALKALESGEIEKVFLARPAVGSGKDMGALPGELNEKLAPFMYPLYDELRKLAGSRELTAMMESGVIELAPIEYMRGRTFSKAFVIVDEAQNATFEQLKMALTRIGEGSKMVVTGDPRQSDLKGDMAGGFDAVLEKLQNVPDLSLRFFTNKDIVRSKIVGQIVDALESPKSIVASAPKPIAPQGN